MIYFDFLEHCVKFFQTLDSKWDDHILRLSQKPENKRWRGFCRSCGKKHQKFARHVDFYGDRDITRPNNLRLRVFFSQNFRLV